MKYVAYIAIAIIAFMIVYLIIPKSCEPIGKYEQLEQKAIESKVIDSLLTIQETRHQAKQDSIIRSSEIKDSIAQLKISVLQKGYNAQRAIIKHLTTIRIDSVGQVVNNVPIAEYNALIESGNKCDSMLAIERERIAEKDTIIKALNNKFESEKKLTESAQNKSNNFEQLSESYKSELKKVKNENKILKFALGVVTLLHLVH